MLILLGLSGVQAASVEPWPVFRSAQPVWPAGREREKNLTVGFRAVFEAPAHAGAVLRVTGSSVYRIHLNGAFLGYGPVRGPHGYSRVDEWDLAGRLGSGVNVIAIEVAGYNVNSYYLLDQPAFLQAEVAAEGQVLASTAGGDGGGVMFEAQILPERAQRVQRYSFQRPFSEVYGLAPETGEWRTNTLWMGQAVACAVQPALRLLPRRAPYPDFARRAPGFLVATGAVAAGELPARLWKDRSLTAIGPQLGGYTEQEIGVATSVELQRYTNVALRAISQPLTEGAAALSAGEFRIYDFGVNLSGFVGLRIDARRRTRLVLSFDEVLTGGDVDFKRLDCVNLIDLELESGPHRYDFESFEPYTLRYLKCLVLDGDCAVEGIYLREYANPEVWRAQFAASDERFNRLFEAGRETYRQNAVDLFTDCPSRERAGWLCDSYFIARVARDLGGDTRMERNFLENYQLPARFEHLPPGMLPMCYPADHDDGVFIPNWALWFVVQLEEYLARSGDRELVEALRSRVFGLFDYFEKFRNADGLLEKLEGWVFVEWSKANDFVQEVNYPSNMLFAEALAVAGRLYDRPDLAREAERIRALIRRQAFDGEFFVDNARRQDGRLELTRNRSEVCQYFAFYFGVATPTSHPLLWHTLVSDFGPQRKQTGAHPEVHFANAFIGNVLRLELLSRYGRCQQVLDESLAYQLHMVERTGTLWEHDGAYASCNHGFAAHGGVHTLYRDVLGLYRVDPVNRRVDLRFTDLRLDWCEGRMPVPDGWVELRWKKEAGALRYRVSVPAGYTVTVENQSRLELSGEP
jgi:alpha-L-rhamnosidase